MGNRGVFVTLGLWVTTAVATGSLGTGTACAATTGQEIRKELGLSGYLQAGYTYNFQNPTGNPVSPLRWEGRSNGFTLDLAELQFLQDAVPGGVGYKIKLIAGDFAKTINGAGIGVSQSVGSTDAFDLLEAYGEYVAPVGNGVRFRLGRMGTFHGAEVLEARDNATYSRSLLFTWAEPLTHTGLMISYPFSEALTAGVHIVNGWDVTSDNNRGKSLGANIIYTPGPILSTAFNVMVGPEQKDQDGHNRLLFTWVGTVKPVNPLAVVLAFDYGTEKKAVDSNADDIPDRNATWWGVSGTARYDVNETFSVAARGEYFDDRDGARTSVKQKVTEVTLAAEVRLAAGIALKPEYRHDWSDKHSFLNNQGIAAKKGQDTVALGAMYTW